MTRLSATRVAQRSPMNRALRLVYVNLHYITPLQEPDDVGETAGDIMHAFDRNQDGVLDAAEVVSNKPLFRALKWPSDANWRELRRQLLGPRLPMYEEVLF